MTIEEIEEVMTIEEIEEVVHALKAAARLIEAAPRLFDLVKDAIEDACEHETEWNAEARKVIAYVEGKS